VLALVAGPLAASQLPGGAAGAVTPDLHVKVNFSPAASALPAGFTLKDTGGAFNGTSGWVRQDSLSGTHVPLALPLNTRDRSGTCPTTGTLEQRTFLHMQAPTTTSTNDATPGAWEYAVPNGSYQVTVGIGDITKGADAESHSLNVEGVPAIISFPASAANSCTLSRLATATVSATVTDGRLTVDALTGINTKLQYVTIDNTPDPVAGLSATVSGANIDLDWADQDGAASYRVYRGVARNLLASNLGTPVATGLTSSQWTDTTAVKGQVYYYAVVSATGSGTTSPPAVVGQIRDDASPTLPTLPLRISFRDAAGTAPAGYTKDSGQNFTNERGYGWVDQGAHTPLDLTLNGRTRTASGDVTGLEPRLVGTLHLQWPNTLSPANGRWLPGAWELAVPNGKYDVEVSVGDATPGGDTTTHELNVEGVNAVHAFATVGAGVTTPPPGVGRFRTATLPGVQVSDGRLTVDAIGGTNTKINYIVVTPTPADPTPAAPTAVVATAGDGQVALSWTAPADTDLAGYDVFRGASSTPLNSTPVTGTSYTDTAATNGVTTTYAVVAVDNANQTSAPAISNVVTPETAAPQPVSLPFDVSFTDQAGTAPAGYVKDYGLPFGNTRGTGWINPSTGAPLSLVGNGRTRTRTTVSDLQNRLIHVQGQDVAGQSYPGPGAYEVTLPNGRYVVTASVGDQPGSGGVYDSQHTIRVEGVTAINAFQAAAGNEYKTGTVTVDVTDGKLTVDATGGFNTKLNYLQIDSADVTPPAVPAPTATSGDGSVSLTWTAVPDAGSYRVYRSTTTPVPTTTPLAEPTGTSYADNAVTNGTTYHYVVTALDAVGNESAASSDLIGTPADATAPDAPPSLNASAGDGQVTLAWTASAAPDVVGFRVYGSDESPVVLTAGNLVGSTADLTLIDTGLPNGTVRYYVVTALDAAGNESAASVESSATPTPAPDVSPPDAVTGLSASSGDAKVTLTWTASGASDLRGYRVFRSATAGGARTQLTAVPQTATTYVDATVTNGTTYYYVVLAADLANNDGAVSNEVFATPVDTTAPAVPSALTATPSPNALTLRWAANVEPDLRRYIVYRGVMADFALADGTELGTVSKAGSRTWLDSDLDAGRTYYYAITAEDLVGNESAPVRISGVPTAAPDTTAPNAPAGLTSTNETPVQLVWGAVTAGDLQGYNVYRSSTATGARTKLTATPIAATTFSDATATPGTWYYVVTAVDTSNNESSASNQSTSVILLSDFAVQVDFQTAAAPAISGHLKDTGAAFTSSRGYGWVRQDSLSSATHTPFDLTTNTRLRTRTVADPRQNNLIHLQYGDITPAPAPLNGTTVPGAWEYSLPNGRYTVTVSAGDQPGAEKSGCPAPCYDSRHNVRVEGATAINNFQATATTEFQTGTVTVDVTDGKLTVDAIGGNNTKINYVDITSAGPVGPDTTAPATPGSVTALPGNNSVQLSWAAPADGDVAGYRVYRSTTSPVALTTGNRLTTDLLTGLSYADGTALNGTHYFYVVTATDTSDNTSAASGTVDATPAPISATAIRVDFLNAASAPPAGYLADWGQAFGARTDANQGAGNSFGWVNVGTSTPLSLVGNGRNRNTESPSAGQPDARLATFVHMQYSTGSNGVTTPGSWELAVPNGAYTVTVAVGDAGPAVDSTAWINVENQNAIASFVPTAGTKFATATRTVVVADGRLTLSPAGGTNTKIAYVDVTPIDRAGRPYAQAIHPTNGEIGVVTNVSPTTDNVLNAETGAVKESSLLGNVTLTRVVDGVAVPGHGATSGGGDTVTFQADAPLAANTLYRFDITAGVTDNSNRAFLPFSSVFTTAGGGSTQPPGTITAAFDKVASGASAGKSYTSLTMGPDGKLYAGSIYGQIYRWTVNADGTLSNEQVINTVRTHATAQGWEGAPNRTIIGLAFDPASTADNLILWITDNYAYLGSEVPDATGAVAKLTGADLQNYQEVLINLPRSIKDHETNSIAFHDGKAYIIQGSMNAMGAAEGTWKKEEHLLSAAVLELDPTKLGTLPLDVATPDLSVPARSGRPAHAGTYDPYAASAPLTFYATGIRNGYDLVWHSNGHLYAGVNGSAAGGATPATPATLPAACATRPDGAYTPSVGEIRPNNQAETDYIFDLHQGKYYGHPNPLRCEYVLNAGNPAGYTGNPLFKVNGYPLGTAADPNYDLANVYDAGLHASANGAIEYKNTGAFGGAFAGKLVVVRYSANQEVVAFDVKGNGSISAAVTGLAGFTGHKQPLDVIEDVSKGNLYVSQLTDNPATTGIVLLKPQGGTGPAVGSATATSRLVFTDVKGGAASAPQNAVLSNVGAGSLTVTGVGLSGSGAGAFSGNIPGLPVTLPSGGTYTVPIVFNPTASGPQGATLTFTTDAPTNPVVTTVLRGLGTDGTGGTLEPSLQWILDTLQIPVNVGDPNPANNDLPASSALIGDEVAIGSFTKAAFDHAVTVEPISLFGPAGPTGNPYVVTVGVHPTGTPASSTALFRGGNAANQTVLPAITPIGEYDLEAAFGFDFTWHGLSNRVAYSEDALNTWDPTNPHKVRVYPLKNADGSLEPNAYVIAPEDVLSPVDFQDAALIVRNVKPADSAGLGKATVSPSELVFSGVKGTTSAQQTVTVTNTGSATLTVSGAALTGGAATAFALTGAPTTVAPGGVLTLGVRFTPGASTVGVQSATLRITTDSSSTPTVDVGLFGLATNGEQGDSEPPLKQVVDALGRPINVGGTNLVLGTGAAAIGDEVLAPLFQSAGTGPVTMKPVARYSPDEVLPFGWYEPNSGEPITHEIGQVALDNEQTLNPATNAPLSGFTPTGSFGFYVDSRSFNRKTYTQDGLNTGTGRTVHAVRSYPAKDRSGALLPNTWIVAFEDATNGDYQDYVFEVTGVKLAGSANLSPVARVDFAPATSQVAAGYFIDSGAAYTATTGRGWVIPGTATPLNMSALTRDRAGAGDVKLSTLLLMQPTAAQSAGGPGAYEYALANGAYTVTVGVGDPDFTDSTHRITVEGVVAVPGFAPTAGELSRTATVTVQVTDGRLTIDPTGGTNTKIQFLDIDRVNTGADTTAPTVSVAVSGLQQSAGVYKNSATFSVVATDTGSGVASSSYSVNGAAFTPYTAPVVLSTPGTYSVRARAQDVVGNVATTAAATTITIVAAGASKANVVIENGDGVPYADRLVMSRIQSPETGARCRDTAACDPVTGPFFPVNVTHDTSTLRIRNTGTEALNVTALPITGPFVLGGTATFPLLVPVGGSVDVPIRFVATTIGTAGGIWTGTVTVVSDDADEANLPVELAGFWQSQSENNQEPSVAEVARTFGYTTAITSGGTPLNEEGRLHASGDEVLSPFWVRASTTAPVTVRQLAAYHTQGNTATVFWHPKTSSATTAIVTHAGVEGQSVLPHRNGSTTVAASGTFTPTTAFGFKIDGEWSDDARNDSATDITNGCVAPCGHHVRFWPVRDRTGALVPDTYLMSMDYSGINYDYNDNIYLVSNIRPETAANPSAAAPVPGAAGLVLGFDTTYTGTLVDKDGQTTGFRSTQPNRLDLGAGSSSYAPALLDVVTTGAGTVAVSSSGTTTTGTNGAADNTLVNGLRLPFDATGTDFSVVGRLLGPVSQLDAGSEQEGVQFGPTQDDYVKVVAINRSGVPGIEFYAEQGGTGTTIATATLPASVGTLDLALLADPSSSTVRAAYRVDDGAWVVLPTPLTLPASAAGRFFDRTAYAGVLVSHKGGAPFTATYDRFAVTPGDVTSAPVEQAALYRLDVAGSGSYTDTAGHVWSPDTGFYTPGTAIAEGATVTPLEIAGTNDDVLYRTYRGNVGASTPQADRVISYALPTRGVTTVDVRLLFAERAAGNNTAGKRLFDISAEGRTLRSGFDVFAAAGGQNTATSLLFRNVVVRDGVLDLAFRASVDFPSIAAIEVLCQGATCPVDSTPPAAPTGLGATASPGSVVLDWADNADGDLAGYDVFRADSPTGTFTRLTALPVTASTFTDVTAPASSSVTYRVVANDFAGNASTPSATVTVSTPAAPNQQPIRINTGGPAQTVGSTTWAACSALTACSGWVTGGNAYREADTVTGIPANLNNTVFQTEWTGGGTAGARAFGFDVPVQNGAYQVVLHFTELNKTAARTRLFSVNLEGQRVLTDFDVWASAGGIDRAISRTFTTTVTDGKVTIDFLAGVENAKISAIEILPLDTTPPPAVTGLSATGAETGNTVTWSAVTASDLAGYDVFRASAPGGPFTKLNTARATGTTYVDAAAPAGTSYYQVAAVDTAGNSSTRPATASAVRPPDSTPPAQLTGVTATGVSTGISIAWTASSASDRAGYAVYRSAAPTGTFERITATLVTGTLYVDTAPAVGETWSYRVTAFDTTGNESVPSAVVTATRPTVTTQQPIRINAGGPAVTTGGVSYLADQFFTGGKAYTNPRVTAIAGTTDDVLYTTERSASANGGGFGYAVPVANGTYDVTLRFAEIYFGATGGGAGGTGKRVFSANLEGGTVELANLDLNAVAAPMTAVNRTYRVTVTDGVLDLAFTTSVNQAKLSALEVVPVVPPARTTIRINAGGTAQTVGGTTWSACNTVAGCTVGRVSGGVAYSEADTVTGIPSGMSNALFQSEWTGGQTTGAAIGARAFGFDVAVPNGSYTVRLHFAELNKTAAGQRVFDVQVEGATVLASFDVFAAAGGIDRAVSRDVPVTVTDGNLDIDFLRRVENAKVSAIEIIPT
jgi:fibronectin type 3 domain-containing protein